jgi:hypothetical protein
MREIDEIMDLILTISTTLKIMSETLSTHKHAIDIISDRLNLMNQRIGEFESVLISHKEAIERLQREINAEYNLNKKDKVYMQ